MWYVEALAFLTHGGNRLLMVLIGVAVAAAVSWPLRRFGIWPQILMSYLAVGLLLIAIPLAIIVPPTNALGIAWLSAFWPLQLAGYPPPAWAAPYLFSFS